MQTPEDLQYSEVLLKLQGSFSTEIRQATS